MLDHLPVHVGHPQRAVRPGLDRRRPGPVIARGEELRFLLVNRTPACERDAVRRHDFAVNEIVHGLTDEAVARKMLAE